jgi:hypothetical protein
MLGIDAALQLLILGFLSLLVNQYRGINTYAIGRLFTTNLSEIDMNQKIYIIVSACFYLFSIYISTNKRLIIF